MRRKRLLVMVYVAMFIGVAPTLHAVISGETFPFPFVAALHLMGWGLFAFVLLARCFAVDNVERALQVLHLPLDRSDLFLKLAWFFNEAIGTHTGLPSDSAGEPSELKRSFLRARERTQEKHGQKKHGLEESLRIIVKMSYDEFHSQSAELALFDEKSGRWVQALVVGNPIAAGSQVLLETATGNGGVVFGIHGQVLSVPLRFAGTLFGSLKVEFPKGALPNEQDEHVLQLLALQGSLMLVNSRFTDELLRMRRASTESTQAKTGFLANLSHEIRGPLGIILNGAELISEGLCGVVTEMQQTTLQMVRDSGEHLLDLVNDVLDYAKVEAGKVTPKLMELEVKGLLEDLCNVVRSQAVAKGHKLSLAPVADDMGVICDKRHLRQMIINLLTNAVKYTPEGGKIEVETERVKGGYIRISVMDTGVGIPESEKHKVFAAFERVDQAYSMQQMGTGLGMPLTRRLAEVNGGSVDFESHEGVGSCFWIVLPACTLTVCDEEVVLPSGEHLLRTQGRGEKLLLVEHDDALREMLSNYLIHQGFSVVVAQSGKEVMRLVREASLDLAVVENDMPELTGSEVVGLVRNHPAGSSLPVILLSARAFEFDIEQFLKLGVDRCLSKPVSLGDLAVTVRKLIDEKRTLFDLRSPFPH